MRSLEYLAEIEIRHLFELATSSRVVISVIGRAVGDEIVFERPFEDGVLTRWIFHDVEPVRQGLPLSISRRARARPRLSTSSGMTATRRTGRVAWESVHSFEAVVDRLEKGIYSVD